MSEPDTTELGPGKILGSYRLVKLLEEGGMGRVFLAEHVRLGRQVALKLLRPEYANNTVVINRFFQEARAANRIHHQNIIEITDFIEAEDGHNFFVMELLPGYSLTQALSQHGPLSLTRTTDIKAQVCDALAAAHDTGIVHRDLKPDNIFLTERAGREDFVKLLDFGVAKLMAEAADESVHQTAAGMVLGTPEYMSPEQAGGKKVDHRTDIYSLGVILYQLATGTIPLSAETYGEMVIKLVTMPIPAIAGHTDLPWQCPADLEQLIMQCLEKDPEQRPQSMKEISDRLRDLLFPEEPPTTEEITAPQAIVPRISSRPRKIFLALAGLVLLALGGSLAWYWLPSEPSVPPTPVAQAIPAVPDLAPVPALPSQVKISFLSTPAGATVFRIRDQHQLGQTPFELSLARSPKTLAVEFRLAGHAAARREFTASQDKHLVVVLLRLHSQPKKKRTAPPAEKVSEEPAGPPDPKPIPAVDDQGATIDPFREEEGPSQPSDKAERNP